MTFSSFLPSFLLLLCKKMLCLSATTACRHRQSKRTHIHHSTMCHHQHHLANRQPCPRLFRVSTKSWRRLLPMSSHQQVKVTDFLVLFVDQTTNNEVPSFVWMDSLGPTMSSAINETASKSTLKKEKKEKKKKKRSKSKSAGTAKRPKVKRSQSAGALVSPQHRPQLKTAAASEAYDAI